MKKILPLVLIAMVLGSVVFFINKNRQKKSDHFIVGILQTASFPQLDRAREGFVTEAKQVFGDNITFIVQNAQGSITQAQAIAASFKANTNIDAFYAIATPAVQTLKQTIKNKPIVFSAVTDPEGLHLRDPSLLITGSSDKADIKKQIFYLTNLLPHVKKVGILYSPGEPNSTTLVELMKKELHERHIQFELDGVNNEADVAAAVQHAVATSQVLLIPTDSALTSAFPIVKQIADKAHVPVVVTWTGEKEAPLMQFGVDYVESGKQAANLMHDILVARKSPQDLPVVLPSAQVWVNAAEMKKFNLTLPAVLQKNVTVY